MGKNDLVLNFNKSREFEKNCRPLMDRYADACRKLGIPFFVTACVSAEDGVATYATDAMSADLSGIALDDDRVIKHIRVHRGYEVRVPGTDIIINMDDIPVDNGSDNGDIFLD